MLSMHYPKAESQWIPLPPKSVGPTPLCSSQLALVSHACTLVVYTPASPPTASVETLRHHEHNQSSQGLVEGSPAETECCRWLKELDDVCVCDLLVHLPQFLTKPVHSYTIAIDNTCDVTFSCGSKS
ncbi:hypothetical protein F511_04488 [Dorcoceras hygrometricum]|uniref:Bifunctional inhibitor/plant lipid transfer protein/seed storage helical domain-containing protein n=1 Tax=Dorcoceras hygrometricum TaxID=472368 RepID=A0A2Z7C8B4_9LAMI|nr:hypothetical protein F511_04488 [Dorcoceras hygrometricum]